MNITSFIKHMNIIAIASYSCMQSTTPCMSGWNTTLLQTNKQTKKKQLEKQERLYSHWNDILHGLTTFLFFAVCMIVYLSSKEASDSAKCVSPNLTDLIRDDQKMGTPMLKRKRSLILSILWWVEASCKDLPWFWPFSCDILCCITALHETSI